MRRIRPKAEMSPKAVENLKARLWQMPYLDRISLLACSVIDREKHDAIAASMSLAALSTHMAKGFGVEHRVRIAEFLRSSADVLDHELQKVYEDVSQRD